VIHQDYQNGEFQVSSRNEKLNRVRLVECLVSLIATKILERNQSWDEIRWWMRRIESYELAADKITKWFSLDELEKIGYPVAFENEVQYWSNYFKVEPYFVFAIMREESHFRLDSVSRVGALGLMQLMPKTAKWLHSKIPKDLKTKNNWNNFSVKRLTSDSNYMICLSCFYVARLMKLFKSRPEYVLAAYNAGGTHAKRWMQLAASKNTSFFQAIDFPETKRYLWKVMYARDIYMALYGVH
jgi:soluble lytic murein transglycosylase